MNAETEVREGKSKKPAVDWTLVRKNFDSASEELLEHATRLARIPPKPGIVGPRVSVEDILSPVVTRFRSAVTELLGALDVTNEEARGLRAEVGRLLETERTLNQRLDVMVRANMGKD